MTTEFLASKKFRYLCWTAYALSVLCVSLVGWSFSAFLDLWAELEGNPYSLRLRIGTHIVIFLVNGVLLSGLIIKPRINRNIFNKIFLSILLTSGIIYNILIILLITLSAPIGFIIFVYASFSMALVIYVIQICSLFDSNQ